MWILGLKGLTETDRLRASFKFTAHIASYADVLRGWAGTPDEPVRMSVWEATAHKIRRQKILTLGEKNCWILLS